VLGWDAPCSFRSPLYLIPYLFSGVGEDRACGAGIGGEPVEVFVGEGLG
jgi:hypothetical protein